MAAQGRPKARPIHAIGREERGGWSLRKLQKPCQTTLGILPRLNVPGGTVADFLLSAEEWPVLEGGFLGCPIERYGVAYLPP